MFERGVYMEDVAIVENGVIVMLRSALPRVAAKPHAGQLSSAEPGLCPSLRAMNTRQIFSEGQVGLHWVFKGGV